MGILGLMMHEAVNNHPYIINDLVSSAMKELLAPCFALLSYWYGELFYVLHHRRAMIDYLDPRYIIPYGVLVEDALSLA